MTPASRFTWSETLSAWSESSSWARVSLSGRTSRWIRSLAYSTSTPIERIGSLSSISERPSSFSPTGLKPPSAMKARSTSFAPSKIG